MHVTYSEKVPLVLGSKNINRVMGMITQGELVRATATWKQTNFSVVMSGLLQLHHKYARGMGVLQRGSLPPQPVTLQHPGILSG